MKCRLLVVAALTLSAASVWSQGKPVLVVNAFTAGVGVELPYDLKQMQAQLVAELKVMVGKQFDVRPEPSTTSQGVVYTLDGVITGWRPGNAAKRLFVGLGSGREASDIQYYVTDVTGAKVVEQKDTIRTNFYSQAAGSTGTLAHPIAQKIAERLKNANLK